MKSHFAKSTPAMSKMEQRRLGSVRRYQSLTDTMACCKEKQDVKSHILSTPFIAVPGAGSQLRAGCRMLSVASKMHLSRMSMGDSDDDSLFGDDDMQLDTLVPELEHHVTTELAMVIYSIHVGR